MSFIVKNTTQIGLLDLIAPHSCRGCRSIGTPLCECCKKYLLDQSSDFCPKCKSKIAKNHRCPHCKNLPPIYFIGKRDDLLNAIIHDYKYNSIRALAKPLASLIATRLPKLPSNSVIIPLPTATDHIRARGFDHTKNLAINLAKICHYKTEIALLRNHNTAQVGASRTARLAQAKQAYIINPKFKANSSTTYILLDDVWTTGASMETAIKKLRKTGAKNIVVALLAVSRLD